MKLQPSAVVLPARNDDPGRRDVCVCARPKRYYCKHLGLHSAVEHSSPFFCKVMQPLHIHQEWPICCLKGERHSCSAKRVQANLMPYFGTKHILLSNAELQPLESTARMANYACFTTSSVILSAQAPSAFSAVVKLSAAALSHPCHSSPAPQPLGKDHRITELWNH